MAEDVTALKLGVKCDPSYLTLLYSLDGKKRLRTMPVHFLNKFGPVHGAVNELINRHHLYLNKQLRLYVMTNQDCQQVPKVKIEKMLRIIQEYKKSSNKDLARDKVLKEFTIDPKLDLSKASDEELSKIKRIMEVKFKKTQLPPEDENFIYDVRKDFSSDCKVSSEWDLEEEDFWS